MNRCCCPARAAGRLPGGGQGGGPQRDSGSPSFDVYFFFPESLLLPGAGGGSPARRGAGGERGGCPSTPPTPPVHPAIRERGRCPFRQTVPRPPRGARGVGANLPAPSGRAMSAPAPALRPPCGRPGSPSRPRRAALSRRRGAALAGQKQREKPAGGERADGDKERKKQHRPAKSERKNRVFPRNDRPSLFPLFISPGDGWRGESVCASARFHPPEQRVLGRERGV